MYVGRYVWYVWYAWENIGRMGWEKVRGKMGFFFFLFFSLEIGTLSHTPSKRIMCYMNYDI